MPSILIFEDDRELASEGRSAFRASGHDVELLHTSPEASALAEHQNFDLYAVDLVPNTGMADAKDSGCRFLRLIR